jgi:fibro-slime domain-containing protein
MKSRRIVSIPTASLLIIAVLSMSFQSASAQAPDSVSITGTIRDFCNPAISPDCTAHPDFEGVIGGLQTGQVSSILGLDGDPVFVPPAKPGFTNGTNFDQWWDDVPGVNSPGPCTLTLTKISDTPPTYSFSDASFFPIDEGAPECESGSHFGDQGRIHNYHFTLQIQTQFTYDAGSGQTLQVSNSDDDLWYFINNQLVVDLGGVHPPESAPAVNLDDKAVELGLVDGLDYPMDIFFAERHTTESHFTFTTFLIEPRPEICDNGIDDDGDLLVDGADPDCVVGGEILSLDMTSLFVAGAFGNAGWITPIMAGIVAGAILTILRIKRKKPSE